MRFVPRISLKCAERPNNRRGPFLWAFYEKSNRASTAGISFCQVPKLRHHIFLQQPGPMGGSGQKLRLVCFQFTPNCIFLSNSPFSTCKLHIHTEEWYTVCITHGTLWHTVRLRMNRWKGLKSSFSWIQGYLCVPLDFNQYMPSLRYMLPSSFFLSLSKADDLFQRL